MKELESVQKKKNLLERIGNPLEWSIIDKVLLVLCIQIMFFGSLWLFISICILFPEIVPHYFSPSFTIDFFRRELIILLLYGAYTLLSLMLRKRNPNSIWIAYGLAVIIAGHACLWMRAIGYVTNPNTFLAILGQVLTGLLLFNIYYSLIIFSTYGLMLIVQISGELLGSFQYAPQLIQSPFSDGKIDSMWILLNMGVGITVVAIIFTLFGYVMNRWKKRESQVVELSELLKKMFGRYLSTEVMESLIENPSALELGGEKRNVAIMMTDLRGFTALSERLEPEQVVQMLNSYFEVMVDIIYKYEGTINEFIGDALLVIFGAPHEFHDSSQRAIGCAIEMQNAMDEVNEINMSIGLPELEMGIGINEAEVIVGNIGSSKRSNYTAIGSGVNMASRIESCIVGGQILISESVMKTVGDQLRVDNHQEVFAKGAEHSINVYEVGGISGSYNLVLREKESAMENLTREIPVYYSVVGGKTVGDRRLDGQVTRLSKKYAEVVTAAPVKLLTNLKLNLDDVEGNLCSKDFYGKVTGIVDNEKSRIVVNFTSIPPEVSSYFQAFRKYAEKGN